MRWIKTGRGEREYCEKGVRIKRGKAFQREAEREGREGRGEERGRGTLLERR